MTNQEKDNWLKMNKLDLFVSKQYFHHHAFEILNTHRDLKKTFLSALDSEIEITPRIKDTKGVKSKAIKATDLNSTLRTILKGIPDNELKFEVFEENGVFYFSSEKSSIGGFDFALLNHENNMLALRNLCFGNLQYADGEVRWNKFLERNPDLIEIANQLKSTDLHGKDILRSKEEMPKPLIVGEIQFGNWALAYRDFFKVLKANVQNSIDCLIYIVPTGELEKMLSDGIVTYDKTQKILEEFTKVISVPVWVIGLDVNKFKNKVEEQNRTKM